MQVSYGFEKLSYYLKKKRFSSLDSKDVMWCKRKKKYSNYYVYIYI